MCFVDVIFLTARTLIAGLVVEETDVPTVLRSRSPPDFQVNGSRNEPYVPIDKDDLGPSGMETAEREFDFGRRGSGVVFRIGRDAGGANCFRGLPRTKRVKPVITYLIIGSKQGFGKQSFSCRNGHRRSIENFFEGCTGGAVKKSRVESWEFGGAPAAGRHQIIGRFVSVDVGRCVGRRTPQNRRLILHVTQRSANASGQLGAVLDGDSNLVQGI